MVILGAYLTYALSVHLGMDLFVEPDHHDPGAVRGRRDRRVAVHETARRPRPDGDVDPRHLRRRDSDRGNHHPDLRGLDTSSFRRRTSTSRSTSSASTCPTSISTASLSRSCCWALLYALIYLTRFGQSLRAALQDRRAAELIGIDVDRVRTLTFGIGIAVTAAGGMVFGATNSFNPNSGYDLISRLLTIVILGGLGSIGGALAAAIFMLVLQDVVARRVVAGLVDPRVLRGTGRRADRSAHKACSAAPPRERSERRAAPPPRSASSSRSSSSPAFRSSSRTRRRRRSRSSS